MKDELPTNEDEIIELAKKMIEGMSDNSDFKDSPIPAAELQRLLDNVLKAKDAEAAAKEAEKQANEDVQAALEKLPPGTMH